ALVVRTGFRRAGARLLGERAEGAEPRDPVDARGFPHAGPTEARRRRTALGLPAAHRAADRGGDRRDCTAGGVVPLRTAGLAEASAALARARLGGAVCGARHPHCRRAVLARRLQPAIAGHAAVVADRDPPARWPDRFLADVPPAIRRAAPQG